MINGSIMIELFRGLGLQRNEGVGGREAQNKK